MIQSNSKYQQEPTYVDGPDKKYTAPEQPIGLQMSSHRIYNYSYNCVHNDIHHGTNDIKTIYLLLTQIKLVIRSIWKLRLSDPLTISVDFIDRVNKTPIVHTNSGINTTITLPLKEFDDIRFIELQRSLVPSIDFTPVVLNRNTFDVYIYVYRNILISESSKKRSLIDVEYNERIADMKKNHIKFNLAELRKEKVAKQCAFKSTEVYNWVNFINYIQQHVYDMDTLSDDDRMLSDLIWSCVLLRPSSSLLLKGPNCLLSDDYKYFDDIHALDKSDYITYLKQLLLIDESTLTPNKLILRWFEYNYLKHLYKYIFYNRNHLDFDHAVRSIYKSVVENIFYRNREPKYATPCKLDINKEITYMLNIISNSNKQYIIEMIGIFDPDTVFVKICDLLQRANSMYINIIIGYMFSTYAHDRIIGFMLSIERHTEIIDTNIAIMCLYLESIADVIEKVKYKKEFISVYVEQKKINMANFMNNREVLKLELNKLLSQKMTSYEKFKLQEAIDNI